MNTIWKKALGPAGLLLGALLLTACGDDTGGSPGAAAPFNTADVTFAQSMVPHHQQAVEMAHMAEAQARSVEVKKLAADIEAAQEPEIEQLATWLESWGEEVPTGQMPHDDMGHGDSASDMSGMMTGEDMAMLDDAVGVGFDQLFLEMMVEHHEGAVAMAETEVEEGENADAIALAKEIIATQNDEIDQMQLLLDEAESR